MEIPIDDMLADASAAQDYLAVFEGKDLSLLGLNCNGNPLHPDPAIGPKHAEDLRRSIRATGTLGQTRVVTMSGLPGGHEGATKPNWIVNAWSAGYLDMLEYQWDKIAVPFWREIDELAGEHGVKVAIEMHPQNLVLNPPTMKRLVDKIDGRNVGAEMDPSHLFWQGIDPIAAVRWLGPLVLHAAAKDTRINPSVRSTACSTSASGGSTRTSPGPTSAVTSGPTSGPPTPPGTSSPSAEITTRRFGPSSSPHWPRSIPTCPSTSSTRTTSLGPIDGLREAAVVLREAAAQVRA